MPAAEFNVLNSDYHVVLMLMMLMLMVMVWSRAAHKLTGVVLFTNH